MYLVRLLTVWSLMSVVLSTVLCYKLNVLLCKQRCKSYSGCTSVRFDSKHLHCELGFGGDKTSDTGGKEIRLFEVQGENSMTDCCQMDRIFNDNRRHRKCVKVASLKWSRRRKKELCKTITERKEPCSETATVKGDDEKRCILLRRENIKVTRYISLIYLNMTLEPGMKLALYGGVDTVGPLSSISINGKLEGERNFRTNLLWRTREVQFGQSNADSIYNGTFPISDRSRFTLAFELTKSDIKVYVEKVHVKTTEFISGLEQLTLCFFDKMYFLVVQKMDEECKNARNGIP